MLASSDNFIKKRAVFFIGGFDPKSPRAFFERMDREAQRFSNLWDVDLETGDIKEIAADISSVSYQCAPRNDTSPWRTQTDFHFLTLDDVVLSEFARSSPSRFWRYLNTFWDYVLSGTAFKFIKHSWRFSIYFFYPATMVFLTLLLCLAMALSIAQSGIYLATLFALFAFAISFVWLLKVGGKKYHVLHLIDLWNFSRDFIHNRHAEIGPKLDRLAMSIREAVAANIYDEIILVGHSTGGALILDAAGRAFDQDPQFMDGQKKVVIMTVGSTALKIGLHPSAQWFRNKLLRLFSKTDIRWVEYQCLTDLINFYRTDPSKLMGVDSTMNHPPKIREIRIKQMMDSKTYRRIKKNFFRIHYQFVFGNTKFHHYDFLAICFGPVDLWRRAQSAHLYSSTFVPEETQTSEGSKGTSQ